MEWAERINRVMEYVEQHLTGTLDEAEISRIALCSYSIFLHAFSQAAGVSFSEYVRRRRLTMAAYDLQNTDLRVIDIAARYGYDSPDSFRIAFRQMHGATPTQARNGGVALAYYCPLHFELSIRGIDSMRYTLETRKSFGVAGVRRVTPYGGGTWAVVKGDGSNERMRQISGKFFDLGLCFGFGADGSNDYMCAIEWPEDVPGFDSYRYPESAWIRFSAEGRITANTLGAVWRRINEEFFPNSRYVKGGYRGLPTIEKYVLWDEAADWCQVEIRIPVDEKTDPVR